MAPATLPRRYTSLQTYQLLAVCALRGRMHSAQQLRHSIQPYLLLLSLSLLLRLCQCLRGHVLLARAAPIQDGIAPLYHQQQSRHQATTGMHAGEGPAAGERGDGGAGQVGDLQSCAVVTEQCQWLGCSLCSLLVAVQCASRQCSLNGSLMLDDVSCSGGASSNSQPNLGHCRPLGVIHHARSGHSCYTFYVASIPPLLQHLSVSPASTGPSFSSQAAGLTPL